TFRVTTDGSVSCQSGSQQELNWTVSCLDCIAPQATFEIVQDCDNFQYFVSVNVTTLGSDTELEIANTQGLASTFITAAGTYQIGPFVSGTPVQLQLVNDANSLCNLNSANLVNPLCPQTLCGSTPLAEEYCYVNNENRAWAYEVPPGSTIRLVFQRGTIESNSFDDLIIYDGPSNAPGTPILFEHSNTATWNLGPEGSAIVSTSTNFYAVDVTTTGNNLYMTLTSDGSVQCNTSTTFDPFQWTAQCLGCQAPGVSYSLTQDCFSRTYTTEVTVAAVPGPQGFELQHTQIGTTQMAMSPGVYTFGPYDEDQLTIIGVTDPNEPTCTFTSDSLTYDSEPCIINTCQIITTEHCYEDNTDRWYTYRANENVPITITFLQGVVLAGDLITIYDGDGESTPPLYSGTFGGNVAGLSVSSQNLDRVITMRIRSNASGSCTDGTAFQPLRWDVGCGFVGVNENASNTFTLFPNPTRDRITIGLGEEVFGDVRVRVMDLSGRVVLEEPYTVRGGGMHTTDLSKLSSGQYLVQLATENWISTQRIELAR
nr:T9SS type A sorting domain-containing protein [Flavobacteriales bacterium]